jgi:Tol biopolymer transport system component
MSRLHATVLTLAAFAALGPRCFSAAEDKKAEVALKTAIDKEIVDGDLKSAIEQYKKLAKSGNRAVAATALVHMGQCYEKLGDSEARKAYERAIREFADQKESAATARARLAVLSGSGAPRASEMVARRVWDSPDVDINGAVTPDGQFLTYVDWQTGDLALRDLRTGEKRHLTNKGSWSSSSEFALYCVPSADGRQVAYSWLNKDHLWELRVVGLDGSEPRPIYASNDLAYIRPLDWSPDGKFVLTLLPGGSQPNQIALLPASGGPGRVLKMPDSRSPEKMSFSPDGGYIAYDFSQDQKSGNHDISVLSTDGSRDLPLVQHPADDRLLGWTPDGTRTLFASDRTGSMSLWSIEVANGKAQGAPEFVKADVGRITALGLTRKGAFYYGVQVESQDVYLATLDETTGKPLAAPIPIVQRYQGSNSTPSWSPDEQFLAYMSRRGRVQGPAQSDVIVIRSIKTGEERELAPEHNGFLGPWSPDGRRLLFSGIDLKGIFQIDTETGAVSPVLLSEPGMDLHASGWSPDGKAIFFRRGRIADLSASLVVRDLETGREKEIYRAAPPSFLEYGTQVSRDGRQWAFTEIARNQPGRLMVVSTSGGEPRRLLTVNKPERIERPVWTPDSHYILFTMGRDDPQQFKVELCRVPVDGGAIENLGLPIKTLRDPRLAPDGRSLAFTAAQGKSEVWVLENFLPADQKRAALRPGKARP